MTAPTAKPNPPGPTGEDAGQGPSALADTRSHLRLWPVAAMGLALDLWTKQWAFANLAPAHGREVIPNILTFHRSLNRGALFGLGKGWTPLFIAASLLALGFVLFLFAQSTRDRRSLHVALALVLAGALGNLYDRAFMIADVVRYTRDGEQHVVEGKINPAKSTDQVLVLGSWPEGQNERRVSMAWNTEVWQQGVVRDFIRMEPRIRFGGRSISVWPWVFNVADAFLVVGVGLLLLNFWWERRAEAPSHESVSTPAGPVAAGQK